MREEFGDIWMIPGDVRCITTNGTLKANGACIMGRGVALQARLRYPGLDMKIGKAIRQQGNHLYMIGDLCTFPVKHNWWEKADLELIRRSAVELALLAGEYPGKVFLLPRPGCDNGQLRWEDVKPIIQDILPDNVIVVTRLEESHESTSLRRPQLDG